MDSAHATSLKYNKLQPDLFWLLSSYKPDPLLLPVSLLYLSKKQLQETVITP